MRISDWVQTCALPIFVAAEHRLRGTGDGNAAGAADGAAKGFIAVDVERGAAQQHGPCSGQASNEAAVVREVDGRAGIDRQRADRKRGVSGKSVSVRVVLGGRRFLKKKTQQHKR